MANNVIFSKQFLFVIWTKRLLAFLEKKESCIETAKVLLLSSQKKRQRSLFWGCFEAVFFLVWWETTTRRQGILTHRAAGTFRDMGTGPNQFYQIHYPNSNQDGERLSHPIDFIPTKMFDIPVVLIFRALARLPTTYLVSIHPLCFLRNSWKGS